MLIQFLSVAHAVTWVWSNQDHACVCDDQPVLNANQQTDTWAQTNKRTNKETQYKFIIKYFVRCVPSKTTFKKWVLQGCGMCGLLSAEFPGYIFSHLVKLWAGFVHQPTSASWRRYNRLPETRIGDFLAMHQMLCQKAVYNLTCGMYL